MKKPRAISALALLSVILIAVPILGVKATIWPLIWEADVLSYRSPPVPGYSTGEPVSSPVLEAGREYRIVAKGTWASYGLATGVLEFAADVQYYTPTPWSPGYDLWIWEDPTNTFPAPGGHSFLQIDGLDVDWGPFSNGDIFGEGHEYTILYTGADAQITFTIKDWIDGDSYYNACHIHVWIYEGPPAPPEAETAYAYGGDYATCFKYWSFKNWGWSNGPLGDNHYEFPIYAGAAKCNINKGTLVGTLTIDYDEFAGTATVTYAMNEGWTMMRTHLYVDGEPLPIIDGEYTTSPGQYPYIHDPVVDPTSDTHTVTGLSGDIYVVAHADVVGE